MTPENYIDKLECSVRIPLVSKQKPTFIFYHLDMYSLNHTYGNGEF